MILVYFIPLICAVSALLLKLRPLEQVAIVIAGSILLLRDGVGYDYDNYMIYFDRDLQFTLAPIADFLQDLARVLHIPNGFMGISAIITTGLLLHMSRPNVVPRLSIIVFLAFPFFFLESFSIVRQLLAVVVAAYSYQLLRGKKNLGSVGVYLIATGIHPSAAISLPFFLFVNPNLNWRYLLIAPVMFAVVYVISDIFLRSDLAYIYSQTAISGDYYLIVTGAALIAAISFKDRELIICAVISFVAAIMVAQLGNYVLNRLIVFFYIPFLFAPLRASGARMPVYSLVTILVVSLLFIAAFQVKLKEPRNNFIPYATII